MQHGSTWQLSAAPAVAYGPPASTATSLQHSCYARICLMGVYTSYWSHLSAPCVSCGSPAYGQSWLRAFASARALLVTVPFFLLRVAYSWFSAGKMMFHGEGANACLLKSGLPSAENCPLAARHPQSAMQSLPEPIPAQVLWIVMPCIPYQPTMDWTVRIAGQATVEAWFSMAPHAARQW